jgi:hypothetical protein
MGMSDRSGFASTCTCRRLPFARRGFALPMDCRLPDLAGRGEIGALAAEAEEQDGRDRAGCNCR